MCQIYCQSQETVKTYVPILRCVLLFLNLQNPLKSSRFLALFLLFRFTFAIRMCIL